MFKYCVFSFVPVFALYFSCKDISSCCYSEIQDEIKFMQACMYVSRARAHPF